MTNTLTVFKTELIAHISMHLLNNQFNDCYEFRITFKQKNLLSDF